jgi:threonine/homoserine/homoserine lactone efflux protein
MQLKTPDMLSSYFDGLLYGFIFLFSFGPAFFALLQATLKFGFSRAIFVSLGVNMIDAVLIGAILVGFSSVLENEAVRFWSGWVGAVVLMIFGISAWLKSKNMQTDDDTKPRSRFSLWLKGVALNGLNPMVALLWIGIVSSISSLGYSQTDLFGFFAGFLSTVFMTDCVKSFLITRFSHVITERSVTIVNRIVGSIFVFFGIRLMVYMLGWI